MNRIKGILYAAVSSATFGLAPFFSISLLAIGYSSFEVLTYRWGVATVVLLVFAFLTKWKSHATLTPLAKQDCPLWLQYD